MVLFGDSVVLHSRNKEGHCLHALGKTENELELWWYHNYNDFIYHVWSYLHLQCTDGQKWWTDDAVFGDLQFRGHLDPEYLQLQPILWILQLLRQKKYSFDQKYHHYQVYADDHCCNVYDDYPSDLEIGNHSGYECNHQTV